ncbi:polysaccharide biosynthesis tyrosine autokinase [Paraburkholderia aromaticivorans]|uniref:polysaccharide biosynthesis tyrosine autokinase n=1 Tax=Paraburkholderia aromaticivorans TaxID=2026199 RepID=UPI00145603C7|nr:polysaccharide biosynthesis tyrosine autokinase [Paraburkholderia aromaticivorans]
MTQTKLPPTGAPDSEEELDFVTILDVLIESRWLIGIVVAFFVVAGTLYAFLSNPVYEADLLIQVEDSPESSAEKGLLGDVSSLFDVKSTAAAESQILASRLVVTRAVDNLKLFIDAQPRYFPLIGNWIARRSQELSTPGLFGIGGYAWGNEHIDVAQFDVPVSLEDDKFRLTVIDATHYRLTGDDLADPFIGQVGRVESVPSCCGKILLWVKSIRGRPDTQFVLRRHSRMKSITDLQTNLDVEEKVKQSGVLIASLLDTDPVRVAAELNAVGDQYIRQNVDRKSAEAAQSLEFLNSQLPVIKQRLDEAQQRYTAARNKLGSVDLTEEAKVVLQQSVDAKTKLLELEEQRQGLAARFNGHHPAIRTIDGQIATLRQYSDAASSRIKQLPDVQQQIVQLQLDVQVNTDLYTSLLNNFQQLQLVKAGKTGNVRLVDTAAIPEKPVKPKKAIVLAGSLVVGLFAGAVLAFVRNMLFRGISDPTELERRTGLHVYATIPLSKRQQELSRTSGAKKAGTHVLAADSPNDPAIESLRSLRTALQFAMVNARNNVVLLTGSAPAVGKSFVSVNFAAVLAAGGKKVLLIDGDLRKGHLHQSFGFERGGGFSELVSGLSTFEQVVRRNLIPRLDFVSTGTLPRNPAELLLGDRVASYIEDLSKMYDVVLIDTAPALAAADAGILAPNAGTVFLVARAAVTKAGEIAEAVKRLAQNGVEANGVLFNGLNLSHARYGYGSKYGSYRYAAYEYGSETRS